MPGNLGEARVHRIINVVHFNLSILGLNLGPYTLDFLLVLTKWNQIVEKFHAVSHAGVSFPQNRGVHSTGHLLTFEING